MRIVRRSFLIPFFLVSLFLITPALADPVTVTIVMDTTQCCTFSWLHSASGPGEPFYNSGSINWKLSGALSGVLTDEGGGDYTLTFSGVLELREPSGAMNQVGTFEITGGSITTVGNTGNLASGSFNYTLTVGAIVETGTFYFFAENFGSLSDPDNPNSLFSDGFHLWGNNWCNDASNAPCGPTMTRQEFLNASPDNTARGIDLSGQITVPEPNPLILLGGGLLFLGVALRLKERSVR